MSQNEHDKVSLPPGWWGRLLTFCKKKWEHNHKAGDAFDIYEFTKISRRTISTARRSNQFTEAIFTILVSEVGCDTPDDLLRILSPPQPTSVFFPPPAPIEEKIPADFVGEALASVSSLPDYVARDIATQNELYRLWQIDCAAYGERSITFEQFLAQWLAFPHFPKALFHQNEIAAAIGILPTTEARMKDFAEGRVSEASLQDDPLGQFMIGNVNAWLIDGMVRNPKFPMVATRELVCASILSWINDGLISYPLNIYAIGQNRRGMNLITRAGFKLLKTAESLPDGMPFYVMNVESEAKLLRLVLERLRYYASIAP